MKLFRVLYVSGLGSFQGTAEYILSLPPHRFCPFHRRDLTLPVQTKTTISLSLLLSVGSVILRSTWVVCRLRCKIIVIGSRCLTTEPVQKF